jgi:enamine deaminase RidA (YjgF/YER057c/UK114 family)
MRRLSAAAILWSMLAVGAAHADPSTIKRIPLPNGAKFPISLAVEVPSSASTIYLSGTGADPLPGSTSGHESFGDTEVQTRSALTKISKILKGLGLSLGDVVQVHVYLAGDPTKGGKLDFAGLQKAWVEFFGTKSQPNLPSRSAFQVASLANPAWLVEIEVTAAKP